MSSKHSQRPSSTFAFYLHRNLSFFCHLTSHFSEQEFQALAKVAIISSPQTFWMLEEKTRFLWQIMNHFLTFEGFGVQRGGAFGLRGLVRSFRVKRKWKHIQNFFSRICLQLFLTTNATEAWGRLMQFNIKQTKKQCRRSFRLCPLAVHDCCSPAS